MRSSSFGSLWVPAVAIVALFSALATLRPSLEELWGDEGTYVGMTSSLVRDGDLVFGEADRKWAEERVPGVGATVILQRIEGRLTYSKPVAYALLAAPFYALGGEAGMVVLNFVALGVALFLGWRLLRRRGAGDHAALTILAFLGCAALLPYLLWRVSDMAQFSFTLIGLCLLCGGLRERREAALWSAALGGAALGLVTTMRLPNAAILVGALAVCWIGGRRRTTAAAGAAALAAILLAAGAGSVLADTANPYKAERSSFNGEIGYPTGSGAEEAQERFATVPATQSAGLTPRLDVGRSLYSTIYFFVGRHSGLVLYFPMALLLVYRLLRHPDLKGLGLLAAVAAIAAFYLLWLPENYFGGSTFVGNRYFLTSYAVLLVAAPGLPSGRQLVPVWALGAIVGLSALYSVESSRAYDPMSQSHAYSGVFRFLPYESTAQEIDGQRDRYWSGDFVRFVDPHTEVDDWSFTVDTERPAAELLVATDWEGSPLELQVTSASEPLELRVRDWAGRRSHHLEHTDAGTRVLLEVALSPPWREHRFWWTSERSYTARTLRLSLESIDGTPARATVRYLGNGRLLERQPAREVLSASLPEAAAAGGVTELALEVRNSSTWAWSSQEVVPLYLSYRLRAPDGVTVDGPRTKIDPPVLPGSTMRWSLPLAWPEVPGEYRVKADLVLEEVAWFEDRLGAPLFEATVTVE
jgi:hypothetical protein